MKTDIRLTASGLAGVQAGAPTIHTEETTGQGSLCSRICSIRETARRRTGETIGLTVATLATAGFLLGFALGNIPLIFLGGLTALLMVAAATSGTESVAESRIKSEKSNEEGGMI